MVKLNEGDIKALNACIWGIYSVLKREPLQFKIISEISRLVPSSIITLLKVVQDENNISTSVIASPDPWKNLHIFNSHIHEHPLINVLNPGKIKKHPFSEDIARALRGKFRSFNKSPEGRVISISDALTDRQLHSLVIFNEFFRPNRVEYQLGTVLESQKNCHLALTLNRDKRDFTEKERFLIGVLSPHIAQAFQNAEKIVWRPDGEISRIQVLDADEDMRQIDCKVRYLPRLPELTEREHEILNWVAIGKSNAEIAGILNISLNTVKKHLGTVFEKLGVENRTAAARKWLVK